jgi:hypothetical protein
MGEEFDDVWGGPVIQVYGGCIRCGVLFLFDADTVTSVWVNETTGCPIRPDGAQIQPGEQGTHKEPLCTPCAGLFARADGQDRPVLELFPHARVERITVDAS